MTQQHDKHLTTEQLSALRDKQLSGQELADCNAHLSACTQCQNALADLRQTVALVHALPKADLPRSFVLPSAIEQVPQPQSVHQPAAVTPISNSSRNRSCRRQPVLQRSFRMLGTLAAVVGIILFLSGFISTAHLGLGGASTAIHSTSAPTNQPRNTLPPAEKHYVQTPVATEPHHQQQGTPSPVTTPPAGSSNQHPQQPAKQNLLIPPALDLTMPEGQKDVGIALLILGILALIIARYMGRRIQKT